MLNSASSLRRWFSTFGLAVGTGMLIWGRTVLESQLQGAWLVVYWTVFGAFTVAAIMVAVLDFLTVRRLLRADVATIRQKLLAELAATRREEYQQRKGQPATPRFTPIAVDRSKS